MTENHIEDVGGSPNSSDVAESHVAEEFCDVEKKVVDGEELVGVRVGEEAGSRVVAFPKNLISLLPYRIRRSRFRRPTSRPTVYPESLTNGMGRLWRCKALEPSARRIGSSGFSVYFLEGATSLI
jgi:hypothetical protein